MGRSPMFQTSKMAGLPVCRKARAKKSASGDADAGEGIGDKRSNSIDENETVKPNVDGESESPGGDDDNDHYLVPESKRKLIRMGKVDGDVNYKTLIFPSALVFLLLLVIVSVRRRNKVSAKMN